MDAASHLEPRVGGLEVGVDRGAAVRVADVDPEAPENVHLLRGGSLPHPLQKRLPGLLGKLLEVRVHLHHLAPEGRHHPHPPHHGHAGVPLAEDEARAHPLAVRAGGTREVFGKGGQAGPGEGQHVPLGGPSGPFPVGHGLLAQGRHLPPPKGEGEGDHQGVKAYGQEEVVPRLPAHGAILSGRTWIAQPGVPEPGPWEGPHRGESERQRNLDQKTLPAPSGREGPSCPVQAQASTGPGDARGA